MRYIFIIFFCLFSNFIFARKLVVGKSSEYSTIKSALEKCENGDSVIVSEGTYKEGNICITKSISFIGLNYPILDGEKKHEVVSVKASHVVVTGFKVNRSSFATLSDPCGIKVYDSYDVTISNNILNDNFFGIYLQYCRKCYVINNTITGLGVEEHKIGNGIQGWKSDSIQIIGNRIRGHRDGIYLEFVTNSIAWRNISENNIRYGLHFMFSNHDAYISNVFKHNGAGVAVMFTHHVKMFHNIFTENWGDAAFGLLLKEISDSYISGNTFSKNTSGIFMEGTNRIKVDKNKFESNGWAMKIQASCMDNEITHNNFEGNTFDIGTNGSLVLNTFDSNYWDKYEGYDLNKDKIGDVPYHPLSIFSVIVEQNPPAMLLFRSFMVSLIDKSEKLMPSLTPDNFIDNSPLMRALNL